MKYLVKLIFVFISITTLLSAQQAVDFVTYGANANTKEGDNDFHQVFFIQVSEKVNDSILIELFDPDCSGKNDVMFTRQFDSHFKFSLLGGKNVFTSYTDSVEVHAPKDIYQGKLLKKISASDEEAYDNKWLKFAVVDKKDGEYNKGSYYFKLVVEGIDGNDANVFNIRALSKNQNGIKIINYAPTIHLLPKNKIVQLRFNSGDNSSLIIKNFDADLAGVSFTSPYRKAIKLTSSGNDSWELNSVKLLPFEKNEICAIEFGPGKNIANDAVFCVLNPVGRGIPVILPIETVYQNNRPTIKEIIKPTDNWNKKIADASSSFDKDGDKLSAKWILPDASIKKGLKTELSFVNSGRYSIILAIKDNSKAVESGAYKQFYVSINYPPTAVAGDDVYQTKALVDFNAEKSYDSDGKIITYHWDFGDGFSGYGKKSTHVYKSAGKYNAVLTVKDNSFLKNNTAQDKKIVRINSKPIADAGNDITVVPEEKFRLSASNSIDIDGEIILTEWRLQNKIISEKESFDYSFEQPGNYNIELRVADDSKQPEAVDYDNIIVHVNESPHIVTNTYYEITPKATINFDASKSFDNDGKITSFAWYLNGKKISSKAGFKHKFDKAGNYQIQLFVTDNSGVSNSKSKKKVAIFVNSKPVIKHISDIQSCNNLVSFSALNVYDSDNDKLGYTWKLGDGTTAYGKHIIHTYQSPGKYPVLLIVDDGHNLTNSKDTANMIVKINSAPVAKAGKDEIICTGDVVTLDGSKSFDADGDLLKYNWNFGDGTYAEGISVNKNYGLPGIYQVTLTVTDNSGLECNSDIDTKILTVVESPVAFAGKDIIGCENKPVFFDASKSTDSDGIVNSFFWDFGDGSSGGGEKTSHIYKKSGTYNVVLTITGEQTGECDNSDTDNLIVTIKSAPEANFTYKDSVAVNSEIEFDASLSNGNGSIINNYAWDFGDGSKASGKIVKHTYSKAGNYLSALYIKTDSKAECNYANIQKAVYVNDAPIAVAGKDLSGNVNQTISFDALQSYDPNGKIANYNWDFNDGSFGKGIKVFHVYKSSGKYKVTLTVQDETGLPNNSAVDELQVKINSLPTGEIEMPKFGFTGKPILIKSKNVNDTDGSIKSLVWSIGKFKESSKSNIEFTFHEPGKYDVLCKIKDNNNGITQITKSIQIYPLPIISVDYKNVVCKDEVAKFKIKNSLSRFHIKVPIEWRFPNGKVFYGNKIKTIFKQSGIKKITVVLSNPDKRDEILAEKKLEIFVNQTPVVKISNNNNYYIGGANDVILFDASGSFDPDGDALTYKWDFGDGNKADGVKLFHSYMKPGIYTITLTVSDNRDCGCDYNLTKKVIKIISR